jgi:SAM-dependent methyltransferase
MTRDASADVKPSHELRESRADDESQAGLNAARWAQGDLVERYASRQLRMVESVLIDRYRVGLGGRVLELGCGAGRLTGHLAEAAGELYAIDLSPAMVEYCRGVYPGVHFSVADLRDLSGFETGSFGAVLAPFNVLDVLGDGERREVLQDIRRLLGEGGLLILSSHNRDYARRMSAKLRLRVRLLIGSPRRPLESLRNLPLRIANRRRLGALQRSERDYAIVNDEAHDFSVIHYYISRDAQERQLAGLGFEFLECLDLDGAVVARGESAPACPELHYVAAR